MLELQFALILFIPHFQGCASLACSGLSVGPGLKFNYKPKVVHFCATYGYKRGSEILHKEFTFP